MPKPNHPIPAFRKGKFYIAQRSMNGSVQVVQCKATKPEVILHPPNSTFAFNLQHFDWVIEIPANQKLV